MHVDVFGSQDIDSHAPLAGGPDVLDALADNGAAGNLDVRQFPGLDHIRARAAVGDGNQLGRRIQFQAGMRTQVDRAQGVDHVGTGRDGDRAAGRRQRVDRRLESGGVVVHAVALGSSGAHADGRAADRHDRRGRPPVGGRHGQSRDAERQGHPGKDQRTGNATIRMDAEPARVGRTGKPGCWNNRVGHEWNPRCEENLHVKDAYFSRVKGAGLSDLIHSTDNCHPFSYCVETGNLLRTNRKCRPPVRRPC